MILLYLKNNLLLINHNEKKELFSNNFTNRSALESSHNKCHTFWKIQRIPEKNGVLNYETLEARGSLGI